MSSRSRTLALYRALLSTVARFPSKKKAALREDIRVEFRAGAALRDPARVAAAVETALRGLETMGKYTSLDKGQRDWSVTLDQAPLGTGGRPAESDIFEVAATATAKRL